MYHHGNQRSETNDNRKIKKQLYNLEFFLHLTVIIKKKIAQLRDEQYSKLVFIFKTENQKTAQGD